MNASRLPKNTPNDDLPPFETIPAPIARDRVERRWLGMPARVALLCLGGAGVGASIGLFATGSWAWGILALIVGLILLGLLGEATRRSPELSGEQSSRFAAVADEGASPTPARDPGQADE